MMTPSSWITTSTGDLIKRGKLEIGDGYRAKHSEFADSGVPFLRIGNIQDNGFRLDGADLYPDSQLDRVQNKLSQPGDCVIATKATIGRLAYIDEATPRVLYSPQVSYWRVLDKTVLEPRFVRCWLASPEFLLQAHQAKSSTAMADYINLNDQRRMRITLPPIQVQRRIAAVVAAYDKLIQNNLRRIAILEDMAQALYREWFREFRFPGYDSVDMVDSKLGRIPNGWKVSTVGDVAENYDRLRKPLSRMQRANMSGQYPYYGAAKVIDYVEDYIFDGEYLLVAEDGSVATPQGYPVLQLVNGKFWANNHTHILQGSIVSTRYLYLALSQIPVTGYITGTAQPKITQAALRRVPIVVPSAEIAARFDELVDPMFDLRYNLETQVRKLQTTRDLLLPKLVSGEIDVSDLDIDTDWLVA